MHKYPKIEKIYMYVYSTYYKLRISTSSKCKTACWIVKCCQLSKKRAIVAACAANVMTSFYWMQYKYCSWAGQWQQQKALGRPFGRKRATPNCLEGLMESKWPSQDSICWWFMFIWAHILIEAHSPFHFRPQQVYRASDPLPEQPVRPHR